MTKFTSREEFIIILAIGMKLIKEKCHTPHAMISAMNEIRTVHYTSIAETEMYDILDNLHDTLTKYQAILEKIQNITIR